MVISDELHQREAVQAVLREELADLVGGLLGGLGRVADGLLGPAPVPIPIPVEDERAGEQAPEQPPVGTDPYKYPGTY